MTRTELLKTYELYMTQLNVLIEFTPFTEMESKIKWMMENTDYGVNDMKVLYTVLDILKDTKHTDSIFEISKAMERIHKNLRDESIYYQGAVRALKALE